MGTPPVPPRKPLWPPLSPGSRASSGPSGEVLGSGGRGGDRGPDRRARAGQGWGWGAALLRQPPAPWGPVHPLCPHHLCANPGARAAALSGPRVLILLEPRADTPQPPALLVEEGGAWPTPPASAYSFNFCLVLKGAQSSGLGSLGSPLDSAAGGSLSLPHPHPTLTSPGVGADQDTTEGWRPQLALKCSPSMELGIQYRSIALWGLSFPSG